MLVDLVIMFGGVKSPPGKRYPNAENVNYDTMLFHGTVNGDGLNIHA